MTPEERVVYRRGYQTGKRNGWPDHKPPLPPDKILRAILVSSNSLRDEVSNWLGSISTEIEGDPVWEGFQERLDDFDDVMEDLSDWLVRTYIADWQI